jgi:hypothetical protein
MVESPHESNEQEACPDWLFDLMKSQTGEDQERKKPSDNFSLTDSARNASAHPAQPARGSGKSYGSVPARPRAEADARGITL